MSEVICNCFNVTKDDILEAIKNGAKTLEEVQEATSAGTGCGSCLDQINEVVNDNI